MNDKGLAVFNIHWEPLSCPYGPPSVYVHIESLALLGEIAQRIRPIQVPDPMCPSQI